MAATWESEVLTYRTPPTMSGVDSQTQVVRPGCALTISSSGDRQVQATFRLWKFLASIWASGEYFELALSPP